MLQSIQFIGSGPPTYVYSSKVVSATMDFYHVFATETRGYDAQKDQSNAESKRKKEVLEKDAAEYEEFEMLVSTKSESLQEMYQKEYGRRESFLWRQR